MDEKNNTKVIAAIVIVAIVVVAAIGIAVVLSNNNKNNDPPVTLYSTLNVVRYGGGTDYPTLYVIDSNGEEIELTPVTKNVKLPTEGTSRIYAKDGNGWVWNESAGLFEKEGLTVKITIDNSKSLTPIKNTGKIGYTFTYDQGKSLSLRCVTD